VVQPSEGGVGVKASVGRLTVGGGGVVNEDEKGQVGMPGLEEWKCQSSTARNGGSISHSTGSGEVHWQPTSQCAWCCLHRIRGCHSLYSVPAPLLISA
jgi:hypothetical protein